MFGIFSKKPKDGPPNNAVQVMTLVKRVGEARAGEIIREGALSGNVFCQVFLSQAALVIRAEQRNDTVQHEFEIFTEMAAKSGHAGSQFNLAKLYLDKVDSSAEYFDHDDIENIKQAKYWYGMAAKQGIVEAQTAFKDLEVFDF